MVSRCLSSPLGTDEGAEPCPQELPGVPVKSPPSVIRGADRDRLSAPIKKSACRSGAEIATSCDGIALSTEERKKRFCFSGLLFRFDGFCGAGLLTIADEVQRYEQK